MWNLIARTLLHRPVTMEGPEALAATLDARPSVADPECTCRAQGRDFTLGQSVCLATPKGTRIATCVMVLNNTSWQFTETPCVVSQSWRVTTTFWATSANLRVR